MLKQIVVMVAAMAAGTRLTQAASDLKPVGVLGGPGGSGKTPAVAESVADLRTHVLYHPTKLTGRSLPLLLWGNGGCRDNGLDYAQFLREIASPHAHYVAARVEDTLVGYAGIARLGRTPPVEYEIHTVGVDPAYQGRGSGGG